MSPPRNPSYSLTEPHLVSAAERRNDDPWRADITQRMEIMENGLADNNRMTSDLKIGLHTLSDNLIGVVKLSGHMASIGDAWKWIGDQAWIVAKIAGGCGVVWAVIKFVILQAK